MWKDDCKITRVCGKWNGLYEWGKGWLNAEKAEAWSKFWQNFDSYAKENKRVFWHCKIVDGTPYLFSMHGCIYIHPMNFTVELAGSNIDSIIEVLNKICTDVAEQCGATYEQKAEQSKATFNLCMGNFEEF